MSWTLLSLLDAASVGASLIAGAADRGTAVRGLSFDRRRVQPGDLFCCIAGSRSDDHDHAPEVVASGAAALLVERPVEVGVPQAVVPSVREAMGPIAAAFHNHPSRRLPVAAVTGTNGKTTTTYLLETIARAAGRSPAVIGTLGARFGTQKLDLPSLGTPEAIDLQRALVEFESRGAGLVVMEATSIALHMRRLAGTHVAVAGFSNLTQDHIDEYHGTMEAYFEAKAMLFDPAMAAAAVLNADDPYGRRLDERCRAAGMDVWTCSSAGRSTDVRAVSARTEPSGTSIDMATPAGAARIRVSLVGAYNVDNVLLATGMALRLGMSLDDVAGGLEALPGVPGRLERIDEGQPFTVLVDYAHTPDAIGHAVRAAKDLADGRLVVVFGCGGDRDRAKRPQMGLAATQVADLTIITSDNPRSEDPRAIIADIEPGAKQGGGAFAVEPDRRAAIAMALADAGPGDVVLIAGKGHESGQEIAGRVIPFDDRDVARDLLSGERGRHERGRDESGRDESGRNAR